MIKIVTHTEGKHFMALTKDYEVYSWGNGDGGRLGKLLKNKFGYTKVLIPV